MQLPHFVRLGFLALTLCAPHTVMAAASASGNASGLPANINAASPASTSMGNASGLPSGNINGVPSIPTTPSPSTPNVTGVTPTANLPSVMGLPNGTTMSGAAQNNPTAVPVGTATTGAAPSGTGTAVGNSSGLQSSPVNNSSGTQGNNVSGSQGNATVPLGTSAP